MAENLVFRIKRIEKSVLLEIPTKGFTYYMERINGGMVAQW
jgi:hypothetical protein